MSVYTPRQVQLSKKHFSVDVVFGSHGRVAREGPGVCLLKQFQNWKPEQ